MKEFLGRRGTGTAVRYLLLLIGLFSVLSMFWTAFSLPHMWVVLLVVLGFTAVFTLLFKIPVRTRYRLLILGVLLLIWLWTIYRTWVHLVRGVNVLADYMIPDLPKLFNFVFRAPATPTELDQWKFVYYCCNALLPYTAILTWAVVVRGSAAVSILLTLPFPVYTYLMHGLPGSLLLGMLLVFWLTLIPLKRLSQLDSPARAGIPLLNMAATGLALAVLLALFPRDSYQTSRHTYAFRDGIVTTARQIGSSDVFSGLPWTSNSAPLYNSRGTVNLNNMGDIQFPDMDVMRVYTDIPHNVYLRGYSASVYTGDAWQQSDADVFDAAGIRIDPLMYLAETGDLYFEEKPNLLRIEQNEASSNFLFLPYLFAGAAKSDSTPQWVGDAYSAADGQLHHTYGTYGGHGLNPVVTGNNRTGLRAHINSSQPDETEAYFDYAGDSLYYTRSLSGPLFFYSNLDQAEEQAQIYVNNPPDDLDTIGLFYPEDNADAAYLKFITEEYTQLPDGMQDIMLEWWDGRLAALDETAVLEENWEYWYSTYYNYSYNDPFIYQPGPNTPYWNWLPTAQLVAEEVRQSATYSTAPGRQPANRDFVQYFLYESREGYCVHFASATVAMLRALGVPARYVEGYIVGEGSFGRDGWATVPASNAHAWAEIWIPNFGWIPVDATPGGAVVTQGVFLDDENFDDEEDPLDDTPDDENDETEDPLPEDEESEDEGESQAEDEEDPASSETDTPEPRDPDPGHPGGEEGIREEEAFDLTALARDLALGVLLLALAYLLWWWIRRQRRTLRFRDKDTSRAALYLYTYIEQLASYGEAVSEEATALAQKARFSDAPLEESELVALRREVEEKRGALREALPRHKQIWLWIRGVF